MIKNPFTLEALADSVTRHDTWELLGDPTELLVAETVIKTCDDNMWTPVGEHRELSLDELVEELSDWREISTAEALGRIAQAIDAYEVLCWLADDTYMVCVTRHEAQRLKARWAFIRLCSWAAEGTIAADELLQVGLSNAILTYETNWWFENERRSVVRSFADDVGLTPEQAFRLLNSDGFDSEYDHGFSGDAIRTKRRMAYRVMDYLHSQRPRPRRQTLDS